MNKWFILFEWTLLPVCEMEMKRYICLVWLLCKSVSCSMMNRSHLVLLLLLLSFPSHLPCLPLPCPCPLPLLLAPPLPHEQKEPYEFIRYFEKLIFICVFLCIYVCTYECVCAHKCIGVVCVHVCLGRRLTSVIFHHCFLTCFLRLSHLTWSIPIG